MSPFQNYDDEKWAGQREDSPTGTVDDMVKGFIEASVPKTSGTVKSTI
jgi:hypothetical protein